MLATRYSQPRRYVRGLATTASFPVYLEGDLVEPTSGTYVLKKGTTEVIAATPVVVAGSIATHDLIATALDDMALDTDYMEEWALVIDGVTHEFRREAYVCRKDLYSVLTDQDLLRAHSDLGTLRPSNLDSYEPYREEAWDQIQGRLIGMGNLPQLITNSWAFRTPHLWLTLHLIALDFSTQEAGAGKWDRLAERYAKQYEKEWDRIQLEYDFDEDGAADGRASATPVYFLQGVPRYGGLG